MFEKKLSTEELEAFLEQHADVGVTIAKTAAHFGVVNDTIRRYLRKLREQGVPFVYSVKGIHLVREVNGHTAGAVRDTAHWVSLSMGKLGQFAKNMKTPFRQALKFLPKDKEERRLLRLSAMFIRQAIDYYDSQQDLTDAEE